MFRPFIGITDDSRRPNRASGLAPKKSAELLQAEVILADFNKVPEVKDQAHALELLTRLVKLLALEAKSDGIRENLLSCVTMLRTYVNEYPLRIEGYRPKRVVKDRKGNPILGLFQPKQHTALPIFNGNLDLKNLLVILQSQLVPKPGAGAVPTNGR